MHAFDYDISLIAVGLGFFLLLLFFRSVEEFKYMHYWHKYSPSWPKVNITLVLVAPDID